MVDEKSVHDAALTILSGLSVLQTKFAARLEASDDEPSLRNARAEFLGKKGELTLLLRSMGKVPAESRKEIGEKANAARAALENSFQNRLAELKKAARDADLNATPYDLSLPARPRMLGHRHPVMIVRDEVLDIFKSLGFQISWGPEVELEENNFEKLAFPPDHPATDMQDTFWVKVAGAPGDLRAVMRTHTSPVQVRELSAHRPPLALVCGGAVYRRDDDVTHSPMFHQVEGFYVARDVTFAELKGVLTAFVQRLYGESVPVRFRPSYFPFVEPGAELDVGCVFCSPEDDSRNACRVCKSTGWLEVLGCGMVHPDVLRHCNVDPTIYSGFAFGVGIERLAMLRYGIPDIRVLFENDPRFLAQF